ncbi:MAG: hypothetical protein ACE366_22360 [Bradymonadia bacterium]
MRRVSFALLAGLTALPSLASADIFNLYAAAKTDYVSGSGEVFEAFDASMGYGLEAGVEVLGIDLWGEFLAMGDSQFLASANLGFDLTVGGDTRFTLGAYTGPMFFWIPDGKFSSGVNFDSLSAAEQQQLDDGLSQVGLSRSDVEQQFAEAAGQIGNAEDVAFGWNIARVRLTLDHKLAPGLYIGAQGSAGYHVIVSGEDAVAEGKDRAIDEFAGTDEGMVYANADPGLDLLRKAAGAESIADQNLSGMNYQMGVFLKLELGL